MILIIDNCQKHIDSLKEILETHCFKVEAALTGRDALKRILQHHYKAILLNLEMPDMTGFEITDTINGLKKIEDVPLFFFSTERISIDFAQYQYIWDYMVKPIDTNLLIHKVEQAIHYYEKISILKKSQHLLLEQLERKQLKNVLFQKDQERRQYKER